MSRRSALPGAAELFRSTGEQGGEQGELVEAPPLTPPARSARPSSEPNGAGPASVDEATAPGPAQRLLDQPGPNAEPQDEPPPSTAGPRVRSSATAVGRTGPSGRERHDEKITVYVSVDELMNLERARLSLRGEHGLAVDRGRIVREALAVVLADLEAQGESSTLVRRLRSR